MVHTLEKSMNPSLARVVSALIPHRATRHAVRKKLIGKRDIDCLFEFAHGPVSYAQCQEDIIIHNFLRPVKKGFYVDVGAAEPEELSVTKFFYERGWSGINIEPRQDAVKLLETMRPRDITLCLAASEKAGTLSFFGEGVGATVETGTLPEAELAANTVTVNAEPLSTILEKHAPPVIHFLKIDVEGHERSVLLGMDFRRFRPWMVVMESTLPATDTPCHEKWERILLDNAYSLLTTHSINRYYCAEEKREELIGNLLSKWPARYITESERDCIVRMRK